MNSIVNDIIHLANVVEDLAAVKAAIAELSEREKILKNELIASGQTSIDGLMYRAAVSICDGRKSIDWETIARHLGEPSRQLITAHTTIGQPYHVVRVSARKGAK